MAEFPWLTIVGIGEDGWDGLSRAARTALEAAELVMGSSRHLALVPALTVETREWPVPFAAGIPLLLEARGRRVVMLASGDPFWFGAGTSVTRHLAPGEWVAHPAPSSFALAAARLGWSLQDSICLGLHAAPFGRLRPHLAPASRLLLLIRDGVAASTLASYLEGAGFGASVLHILEALGGPRERIRQCLAEAFDLEDVAHPVLIGVEVRGVGEALPRASGLDDAWFASDGQMTKRPVRALTLSALAPRPGELLWDLGAGSGSVGIEWLLAHPAMRAVAVEADATRAARAQANAAALGVDRLQLCIGRAPEILPRETPDAVFIGGGLSAALLEALWARLPTGTRIVANAVTLESEALLAVWQRERGGTLLRIELADAAPLGSRTGWRARYPVVQWSVTR
ncbi:bifunctional cobalt-precorrin-7 (C(5))-methyltransferase/cobalt-precorrin-6B (C(15))-methyltransferase [Sphingomonas sp. TDK1]|uniref:bifunctional cobalt-precorrin-7 (C(5))-methyltransferase/cobalt-precorrin-6B (C(15))-methyltransferase n=1 Tax=Sphingomonas sp. TDK1 TaxID=453247 RepID=UPI0007D9F5ED|nr:bifunctional cobalt-precorrin-7 (C(5))-methyltransferase/cobalt-precorrin-6B (C(15))-methyltransferase [Sphingomonas sp. TDK1]OAN60014.1 precorrin-6Y methyltransferase [Sphingomonas sp. TDK1]